MSDLTELSEKNIINTVEDFDYSTQDDSYNSSFRIWRKNKNNPFAFNFKANKKESVFIDGQGFVNKSAAEAEREVLGRILFIIGNAMLIWTVIDNIAGKVFIQILSLLKINIHTTFFNSSVYGGSREIVSVLIIISVFKVLTPMLYLNKKLKMPPKVKFMQSMNDSAELVNAITFAFVACTITSLPNLYSGNTRELYSFFKSMNTDMSVWSQTEFIVYAVFDIIIMSVLSEMLFRGAIFAALRQFGDKYAVIMTSIMSGLLAQNLFEMPSTVIISFVASIGMLKSGSIFTAFAVSVVCKMYQLAVTIIEFDSSENMYLIRSALMIGLFAVGTITALIIYFIKSNKNKHHFAAYQFDMSLEKRLELAGKTFPFQAVTIICIIAAIIKVAY